MARNAIQEAKDFVNRLKEQAGGVVSKIQQSPYGRVATQAQNLMQARPQGGYQAGAQRVTQAFRQNPQQFNVLSQQSLNQGLGAANYLQSRPENLSKQIGNMGSNIIRTGQSALQGYAQIPSQVMNRQFIKAPITALMATGRTVAMTNPLYHGANLIASLPNQTGKAKFLSPSPDIQPTKNDLLRRTSAGFIQGMTGVNDLASNVPSQNTSTPLGDMDLVKTIGSMAGFTKNPAWKQIFPLTSRVLGGNFANNKVANFVLQRLTKGSIEGYIQGVDQIGPNATDEEKISILAQNIGFGAASELAFDATAQGLKKVGETINIQALTGPAKKQLLNLADTLKEDWQKANRTLGLLNPKTGQYEKMPFWKAVINGFVDNQGKVLDWSKKREFAMSIKVPEDTQARGVGGKLPARKNVLKASMPDSTQTAILPTQPTKQTLQANQKSKVAIDSTSGIQQGSPSEGIISQTNKGTESYLQELKSQQSNGEKVSMGSKLKQLYKEIKSKFVDSTAPIQDAVNAAERQGQFRILPKADVRLQIDRVLRSRTIAEQFAKDNGLVDVIKKAPDLDVLDQYMIAKHAQTIEATGRKTGRDLVKDKQLIQDLGSTYEPFAQQVTTYSRKLLDYATSTGLISKDLATRLKKQYPDYVPLQRIMDEVERTDTFRGSGIASQGSQSVVARLKGSERQIASPIASLIEKTNTAFAQGERNVAAQQLASYKDLPGFEGLLKEVKGNITGKHTISFMDNGVKRTFETTPELEAAAKSLNKEQMGIIGKILSVPTRILRLGATGINLPFVGANIVKDQLTGFINSSNAAKTSLLNPGNFLRALFSAVKHNGLYDELIRTGAGGTSFDIGRMEPKLAVGKIRASRSVGSKVKYTVTHPEELITALENLIGRSEELGRLQQFGGTKQALLAKGRTAQDSTLLAAQAARENTANFARAGDWGRVLNAIIPYFNAGIQGSRATIRAIAQNPTQTAAKIAVGLFTPVAAATMWNLADPERKKVYEDIDDFEKENNIIIILDPSKGMDKGRYNGVIKIPLQQGFGALSTGVRQGVEQAYGLAPAKMGEIAAGLIQFGTSLNVGSPRELLSSLIPQGLKVPIEASTNTNLFTGKQIVPEYMLSKPKDEQVFDFTSGTARKIGGMLNVSPLQVQNAVQTSMGGVGRQALNASDTVLNKMGVIPASQVGGESVGEATSKRFTSVSGGKILDEAYKAKDIKDNAKRKALELYLSGDKEGAIKLKKEHGFTISKEDITRTTTTQKNKATKLYVEGKTDQAKEIKTKYGLTITQEDVTKAAKKKALELYKLGLKEEAIKLKKQYGFSISANEL